MSKDFFKEEGVIFTIFFYLHKILTWGYVAEILMIFLGILMVFLFFIIAIKHARTMKVIFIEKYKFLRYFLGNYLLQKWNFILAYWVTIRFQIQHMDTYMIIIVIILLAIGVFFVIFAWVLVSNLAQTQSAEAFNQTLNQSL